MFVTAVNRAAGLVKRFDRIQPFRRIHSLFYASYAGALFGTYPEAMLISVTGCSSDCGEELSPSEAAVVPEMVDCVWEWWNANGKNPCMNKSI
jgi:hypothetical protein